MISATTKICMVIGDPVNHSLSPLLHNTGYRAAGMDDKFVYVACKINPKRIAEFTAAMRAMGIRGASCTVPHKEIIMPYLDAIDPVAEKIGAVNTVVLEKGKLHGYNTDWLGTIAPLNALTTLEDKRVVVIGAGGAARAMVYGLIREGALVTVCNRTVEKAEALAHEFGCHAASLSSSDAIRGADIICNATTIGMHEDKSPVNSQLLNSRHIIFDAVYAPYETRLTKDARTASAQVVHGTEMLLHQAIAQFKLFTGRDAPEDAMRSVLLDHVGGGSAQ